MGKNSNRKYLKSHPKVNVENCLHNVNFSF